MKQPHQCRLSFEATVPEEPTIEKFINFSLNCNLICPKYGLAHTSIKKNGHDQQKNGKIQKFRCKSCNADFYAHTSYIFHELTKIIIDRLIQTIYIDNLSPKATSKVYNTNNSLITKINHYCDEILKRKIAKIQTEKEKIRKMPQLQNLQDITYWIDETYFRINDKSYALILLIDAFGSPLSWKLTEKRNLDQYISLFDPILQLLPKPFVLVGDGLNTYIDLCKALKRECYLIQHIHSHPWEKAKLHHFLYIENKLKTEHITIEIPYNAFLKDGRVVGSTFKRIYKYNVPVVLKKKRGRPLGTTKEILIARNNNNPKTNKKRKKMIRGRKSLSKNGQMISFSSKPTPKGWNIKRLTKLKKNSNLLEPTTNELEQIISLTYKVMKGRAIQSNRIESFNHVIKSFMPTTGLKGLKQFQRYIDTYLKMRSFQVLEVPSDSVLSYPFHSKIALKNFNQFINYATYKTEG